MSDFYAAISIAAFRPKVAKTFTVTLEVPAGCQDLSVHQVGTFVAFTGREFYPGSSDRGNYI